MAEIINIGKCSVKMGRSEKLIKAFPVKCDETSEWTNATRETVMKKLHGEELEKARKKNEERNLPTRSGGLSPK